MSDNRIVVKRQTARWDPDAEVSVKEAMDFWSFAASAANVVMQLASPGVGYGVVERRSTRAASSSTRGNDSGRRLSTSPSRSSAPNRTAPRSAKPSMEFTVR